MFGRAEYYESRKDFFVNCTRCGSCINYCPVYSVTLWEHYSPRGRIILSQLFELDDVVKKSLFTCLTCGYCEKVCSSGVKFTEEIERVRESLVSEGYFVEKHVELLKKIEVYGNPYGEESKNFELKEAEVVYFPGCTALYKEREIYEATIRVLDSLRVDYYVESKHCCGSTAIRVGLGRDVALKGFQNLKRSVEETGASIIVTSCPGCYRTIKKDYRKFGSIGAEVKHITEFLSDRIDRVSVSRKDVRISYHDPCHLGRHMGVYDEPRVLIESVGTLVELERIREESFCCGGGGGVRAGFKDLSMMVREQRLAEVREKNPDVLVTACPFCYRNLKRSEVEVKDITVLLAEMMR